MHVLIVDYPGIFDDVLIAALLEHSGILPEPLMYLGGSLKQHQMEYYRQLSGTRTEGDWESRVIFFLEGFEAAATEAERSIVEIATMVAADRRRILDSPKSGPATYRLFELLPMMPRFTVERVRQKLNTSFPTANAAIKLLSELGIVAEMTGQKKNRNFSYQAYIALLTK